MERKLLSIIAALAVMMVIGTSNVLAYTPPPGTNPTDGSNIQCNVEGGSTGFKFDGMLGPQLNQFGGSDTAITMDFWWRGDDVNPDSPEWHTYFPVGMYQNLRPDILNGTYWLYQGCTEDQVLQEFNDHVASQEMDLSVTTVRDYPGASIVTWEETQLFVPVAVDVNTAPAPAPAAETTTYVAPETATAEVVVAPTTEENVFAGQAPTVDTTPVVVDPTLGTPAEILADADNDGPNPFVNGNSSDGVCEILAMPEPESGGLDTEAATSGSYFIMGYYDADEGANRVTVTPHGRAALGGPMFDENGGAYVHGEPFLEAQWRTLDVRCDFDEMLVKVDEFLADYGLDHSALIGWRQTRIFTKISDRAPYFGIGNGSGNPESCKVGLGREGMLRKRQLREGGAFNPNMNTHIETWQPGGHPSVGVSEIETVIMAGDNVDLTDSVVLKGYFWEYDPAFCSRQEMISQMNGQVNRRLDDEANNLGSVNDWRSDKFQTSNRVGGRWLNNPYQDWLVQR